MAANNFDFGSFLSENDSEESGACNIEGFEEYLTVKALLCLKFGDKRGNRLYALLSKWARRAAEQNGGGEPGLLFTKDGGEFVSFHDRSMGAEL